MSCSAEAVDWKEKPPYNTLTMKKDTHPTYFADAKIICSCGNKFTVAATKPEIRVEVCAKCHPAYTGEIKLIDTAGRVEKFKTRREKAVTVPKAKKARVKKTG